MSDPQRLPRERATHVEYGLVDVHGSQSDSELTGIADETAADVTLSCDVRKGVSTPGVCRIEKPDSLASGPLRRRPGGR